MSSHWKGLLFGFCATCFWGSFYPVSRFLLGENADSLDPLTLSLLRYVFATLFLLPLVLRRGNGEMLRQCLKKDWKLMLFLGLVGIVAEGVLVFVASKYTTAGRCTLMANASPIFTVLISYVALHEAMTKNKLIGMVTGFLGIAFIILSRSGSDMFGTSGMAIWGDLMALGSGCCWAIYTVFGERVSQEYGGMLVNAVLFPIGAVLMVPVMLVFGASWDFDFSWKIWLGIAYIGGLTNGIANALWYRGLAYVKPSVLGAFGYLSAFIAITLSTLFLHEQLGWQFIVSAILVMGGVYLMMKPPAPKQLKNNKDIHEVSGSI